MAFYQPDLAQIHHQDFGQIAREAGPFLLKQLKDAGHAGGTVVDLGCGSGIMAAAVSGAGYDVLGIDYSADILAIARETAPKAHFQQGSFLDADLPPAVAITAVGEVINYVFDTANNAEALGAFFGRVHSALVPGGVFMVDFLQPGVLEGATERQRIVEQEAYTMFVHYQEDLNTHAFLRHITLFAKEGELFRKSVEAHHVQLYPVPLLQGLLQQAGFSQVTVLHSYGAGPFRHAHLGLLATR